MAVVSTESKFAGSGRDRLMSVAIEPRTQALVSVVIPTLNEAENLRHVLPTIPDLVDELVIVDGGSTDGTVDVVRELAPTAKIVIEPRKGKGCALRTGFAAASGDILVMMDADGSMDPLDIATFVAALQAGADIAKGSRFLQGGGSSDLTTLRTFGNFMLTQAVRLTFGGRYSDLCYGYMAFWRHVLPTFDGGVEGFEVETFLNVRALAAGLRVVEVASFESPRIHGDSHLRTFRDGSRVLLTIARERRRLRRARAGLGVPRPTPQTVKLSVVESSLDSGPHAMSPSLTHTRTSSVSHATTHSTAHSTGPFIDEPDATVPRLFITPSTTAMLHEADSR